MQAKPLHEVLARVVAWHNRHPLALRISPTQVHSIGGVALPFASAVADVPPPQTELRHEGLGPTRPEAAMAADDFASLLAEPATAAAPATPGPAGQHDPHDPAAAPATPPSAIDAEAPPASASASAPAAAPPEPADTGADPEVAVAPLDATATDTLIEPRPEPATAAPTDDEAPIELALALDEVAAQADAEAAASRAQASDADPASEATEALPRAADTGPGAAGRIAANDEAEPLADAPLAERLQAARERAMASGADAPGTGRADLDLPLDGQAHAPDGPPALQAAATPAAAGPPPRFSGWLARLWAGLPLGWGRARAARAAAGTGDGTRLAPLFSRDFMWPRSPKDVARWVQRHGATVPLAPADWPQRRIETDAALLQAARRDGLPHAVTRHVITAAIGVGDRRIRLLVDGQGRIFGPRAFDRRRIQTLGSAGALAAVALLAVLLGVGRQTAPRDEDGAAMVAEAPASAASAAMVAASAASETGDAVHDGSHATALHDAAQDAPPDAAHDAAPDAQAATAVATQADGASAAGHGGDGHGAEPAAAALAAASAPAGEVTLTHEPPPRWPVTRASGPLVAIRPRLSDEARQAARAEVAAARAALAGVGGATAPGAETESSAAGRTGPAATPARATPDVPPRPGPQETAVRVAQQPGTVYAVVTPPMLQRESAQAILAQMMSVRARIPPPVPDHGEVMAHQGRWRAAWWPFATLAEAERARAMLVARGMRAEVIEF